MTTVTPGYYVTVRDAGKVGFLAGPYKTKRKAQRKVWPVSCMAALADPWSAFYAFGVTKVKENVRLKRGSVTFGVV